MIYKAIQGLPQAHARIKGSKEYPDIRGNVYLYEVYNGDLYWKILSNGCCRQDNRTS